jgi:glycosyltransferase involved in cell wall biosynthesis
MPFVSVCTPTFNRRPFIKTMFECFRQQDYPKSRIEWIIVDDGTDKIGDLIETANIPQIKYYSVDKKMALGEKRNFMHEKTKGSIIVYMDDDDYYPPERVSHAVERLLSKPEALCAGSSEIYIYFKHIQKMVQFGPYNQNHATAGTFAFRRELLDQTRYEDRAALAEEKAFLKNYTVPFVQLDPMKCILVFSHEQNTFDKRTLLNNPNPQFVKESEKTVDMFIRGGETEKHIKKYFMEDIDEELKKYEPGNPKYKPDVLVQIKEIEKERDKLVAEHLKNMKSTQIPQIMMQNPGQEPRALTADEVLGLINHQQQQIQMLTTRNSELENTITQLRLQITSKTIGLIQPPNETKVKIEDPIIQPPIIPITSKSIPEKIVNINM